MSKLIFTALFMFACAASVFAQDDYHKVEFFGGYSHSWVDRMAGSEFTAIHASGPSTPTGSRKRQGLKGFDASVTYNFSRYVGAKFDVSGHYGDGAVTTVPAATFNTPPPILTITVPASDAGTRQTSYNFLGGLQLKDNSKDKRLKPFAHFLLGVARQTVKYTARPASLQTNLRFVLGTDETKNNGFAWALGGGLDIRIHRRVDIRVIQFEYNPVRTKQQTLLATGEIRDFSDPRFGITSPQASQAAALHSIGIQSRTQHNFRIGFGIVFH